MRLKLLLVICCSSLSLCAFSQNFPRWGKLSPQEIKLTVCTFDSSATAVVLADYGKLTIDYNNVAIEYHIRVKILDKKSLNRADISIPYYIKDKLEGLSAQTLKVDKTGKVISKEVLKNQIFDVDQSAEWKEKRFTFPDVEVGSILEYRYKTLSQRYTFP